mmetsp:Transcript_110988/g.314830  ORF Transcript_110988/g.314830 Transcript_110988/m.314830 type:complete len:322 (+) Transcript_110988:82-1047(+)
MNLAGETPDRDNGLGSRFTIGLSMALLNCTLSSIGFVMQRRAHLCKHESWSAKLWAAGVVVYISAALPDVISYAEIPQILCVAVACLRLVMVTVMAYVFLREKAGRREWLGMLVVVVGIFLCLHFGPSPNESNIAVQQRYWMFVVYVSISLCALGILLVLEHHKLLKCRLDLGWHYFTLPLATGMAFALGKAFNTELGLRMHSHFEEDDTRTRDEWCMGAMVALCGLLDFYLNMRGAKLLPVRAFIPVVFAIGTSLQYLQSGMIFVEFSKIDPMSRLLSMLGAAFAMVGAMLIRPPTVPDIALIRTNTPPLIELGEFSDSE